MVALGAAVFAAWRRPWRRLRNPTTLRLVVALGVVFAVMNHAFYFAIDALPLGTVAAVEFVGSIALAVVGSRSRRNIAAVAVTVAGVALLADVRLVGSPAGFAWTVANAVLFTVYIVLAHRLARVDDGTTAIDRLAGAMLVAGVVITPLGAGAALPLLGDPAVVAAGVGVGLSSSVIPYVLDQLAMARLPRATYSLFTALLPATAVVVGLVVLRQVPLPLEVHGVAAVVAGVLLHRPAR